MSDIIATEFRYTPVEYRRGMWHAYNRSYPVPLIAILAAVVVAISVVGLWRQRAFADSGPDSVAVELLVAAVVGAVVGVLLLIVLTRLLKAAYFRRSSEWRTIRLRLESDALHIDGNGQLRTIPWSDVRRVWVRDGLYLLRLAGGTLFFVPVRVFLQTSTDRTFRRLVHEAIPESRLARSFSRTTPVVHGAA